MTKIDSKKDKRYHRLRLINKNIKDKYDSLSSENSETANTFKNNLIQNLIKVIQKDSEYNSSPKSPFKKKIDEMIETFLSQQASQKDKSDDDDVDGVSPRPEPFVHGAAEHANRIKEAREAEEKAWKNPLRPLTKRGGKKTRKKKRKGNHGSSKRKTKGGNHAKQTRRRKKNRTTKTKGPPNGIITKAWIKKQCPCRDGDNCIACPGDLKKYKDGRKH